VAQAFAKKNRMAYFEVSAKNNSQIDDLFQIIGCTLKP
jgi:hypothetical protein